MSRAIAILLAVAIAAALAYVWQLGGDSPDRAEPGAGAEPDVTEPRTAERAKPTAERAKPPVELAPGWERLSCRLRDHRHNDGDSFHVQCGGRNLEVRLYYVDAPETAFKRYRDGNNNGKRLGHQGRYFGIENRDHTVAVGTAAKKFTREHLGRGDFTVYTRREKVFDSDRVFAMVEAADGYLSEQLVARGLARIYTVGRDTPRGRSVKQMKRHLRSVEDDAKARKLGGWSYANRR